MKYPPINNRKSCNQANVQFNQSQISSDRLNISEFECLLHPLRKKRKAIGHAVFYHSEQLFFMSLGFADVSELIFERMGQFFSRSNFFVKFVFLSVQFDSLTRWVMIPWHERFEHRALYHKGQTIRKVMTGGGGGGGGGIFELQEFFFRYQIPCMNLF